MKTKITNLLNGNEPSYLEKYAQVVSSELMNALRDSAEARGVSLDMEIALRLMAKVTKPGLSESTPIFNSIMSREFSQEEAVIECKHKRQAALYLYEVEKLRNYLRFERSLPRNIKETYTLIDVKEESIKIRAEIEAEDKKNRE